MKVIEIEEIDAIALEMRERMCTIEDFDEREAWELKAFEIIRDHLKQYIKEE